VVDGVVTGGFVVLLDVCVAVGLTVLWVLVCGAGAGAV